MTNNDIDCILKSVFRNFFWATFKITRHIESFSNFRPRLEGKKRRKKMYIKSLFKIQFDSIFHKLLDLE